MKVDVLTVDDVEIKKYHWWSQWVDICIFQYGYTGYLLQMKVSRTNAKKFKHTAFKSRGGTAHAGIGEAGDLTQMSKAL